jgi:hypothetical protein
MRNAEIADLLNKAAHALMGGIPLTDKSKEQLVKDLLFAALTFYPEKPGQAPDPTTAKIILRDVKSSDGWAELAAGLQLPPNLCARYFEHGEFASLELVFNSSLMVVGGTVLPIAQFKPTPQHTLTRGMTADVPPPRTKKGTTRGVGSCPHCGSSVDELGHKADCPLRTVTTPITRHPRYGTNLFAICHWDTFDSDDDDGGIMLVGGADTLEEAITKVKEHYGDRLKDNGADQVDIIDPAGNVVWKHHVG